MIKKLLNNNHRSPKNNNAIQIKECNQRKMRGLKQQMSMKYLTWMN